MSQDNVVFGEVDVSAKPGSGYASIEDILKIGRQIWKRIETSGVSPQDDAGNDKLLEKIQAEFNDFTATFPIIVRWAVQLRKFSGNALEKYIRLHSTADLKSREGFLKLQAEYLVMLFREENGRRLDEKAVQAYRNEIIKRLMEEDKAFQDMKAEAEKEAAEQAAAVDTERRQKLFEFLRAQTLAKKAQQESSAASP